MDELYVYFKNVRKWGLECYCLFIMRNRDSDNLEILFQIQCKNTFPDSKTKSFLSPPSTNEQHYCCCHGERVNDDESQTEVFHDVQNAAAEY